jgi:hypothetical protein
VLVVCSFNELRLAEFFPLLTADDFTHMRGVERLQVFAWIHEDWLLSLSLLRLLSLLVVVVVAVVCFVVWALSHRSSGSRCLSFATTPLERAHCLNSGLCGCTESQ